MPTTRILTLGDSGSMCMELRENGMAGRAERLGRKRGRTVRDRSRRDAARTIIAGVLRHGAAMAARACRRTTAGTGRHIFAIQPAGTVRLAIR